MGRHSRKGPAPKAAPVDPGPAPRESAGPPAAEAHAYQRPAPSYGTDPAYGTAPAPAPGAVAPGSGRRRRSGQPGGEHTGPAGQPGARTRGGHPEQHETGGGWGGPEAAAAAGPQPPAPGGRRRQRPEAPPAQARIPGPRGRSAAEAGPLAPAGGPIPGQRHPGESEGEGEGGGSGDASGSGRAGRSGKGGGKGGGKGRTFTGIAAAAVTTVLAVVVAGQVAEESGRKKTPTTSEPDRPKSAPASGPDIHSGPVPSPAVQKTVPRPAYAELMAERFPISRDEKADGVFEAVPGNDRAPGRGEKIRYRVDIEKGLDMDGALFANAIQRTLNDERSWAGKGAVTFERISSGEPEFVVTLASPGTTNIWCAKSGLNTDIEDVSCDSASTDRVMINAYRWGQGSETYGPEAMHAYRQMLINHEVGHRLGHGHVNCGTEGALAPVMQQQTKSLNIGGIECRPNPWPYPGS
ncbi:hypothetical protein GCM10010387_41260 [Streptomyces inusitatus]|uniref:DUF3152 domain-containing protein n=1 Tax=Streptomyces inusitatus TaxID=68221 RepID=A0A918QFM6_9ACTN|nr:DUF3152 domain-containing protein [Streptomyces inusitatus]GGZ42675.1 hypothetical protein GCM10010387_41260 [Streptomyces inusitatus]